MSLSLVLSANSMAYWNPLHPPPRTPMRSAVGAGFCCAITSLTFSIAFGVKVTIILVSIHYNVAPHVSQAPALVSAEPVVAVQNLAVLDHSRGLRLQALLQVLALVRFALQV